MDIENVKIDWAPVLESQISSLEERFPGRSIRENFTGIINDLKENRIKSRLILSGKEPAGYAYYILPDGMTDRILGNVGFVDRKFATGERTENLLGWLKTEAGSLGRLVMINDIFNGSQESQEQLVKLGFTRMERFMMEVTLRNASEEDPSLPEGYEIEGLGGMNIAEYAESQVSAFQDSEDRILFSTKKEEQAALTRSIFEESYGPVITEISRVARTSGKIVGACIVVSGKSGPGTIGYPLIIDVFVSKDHRGKKIAKALLLDMIRRAKISGLNQLYLWVNVKNKAVGLYRSVGFTECDFPREVIHYTQL